MGSGDNHLDWSPSPDFLFLIVLPFSQSFFEVQVNTSVILRVVVVLLVLELCLLGLRFESPANCLRSESGFQIEKTSKNSSGFSTSFFWVARRRICSAQVLAASDSGQL